MSIQLRNGLANQTLDHVLEDLIVRFLINVPEEDLSSIERIFFQVEEAHWFYLDFVRQLNPNLPALKMRNFSTKILEKCPLIWKWGDPTDALSRFGKYKSTIPVRGVALFTKDLSKILLVKGTESNTWSFPRGKISKDESDVACAVREVEEEIGFNTRDLIVENDYVERTIKGKNYKIFLVKNVPEDTKFEPLARFEISEIKWFDIKSLQKKIKSNPNNYFIVATIMKAVLKWISKNQGVQNEEELMLQAELGLKELMGLNKPVESADAGRELLNILQKVAHKDEEKPSNIVNVPIPQNQMPIYHQHHPFFGLTIPSAAPVQNQQFYQQPVAPKPEQLKKPSTNSKELLSILTTTKAEKRIDDNNIKQKKKSIESENIRSRAQQLLSVFPKKKQKQVDEEAIEIKTVPETTVERPATSSRQIPSNEIEESIRSSYQRQPAVGKKIKLLKRTDNKEAEDVSQLNNSKSNTTNEEMNSPPSLKSKQDEPKKNEAASEQLIGFLRKTDSNQESPKNGFLGLLNKEEKNEEPVVSPTKDFLSLLKKPINESSGSQSSTSVSANKLLSMLNKKPSEITNKEIWGKKDPSPGFTASPNILASVERFSGNEEPPVTTSFPELWIENKNNTVQSIEKTQLQNEKLENFEDFEDFEDFDDNYENDEFLNKAYKNFDIESDDEDVDHLVDPITLDQHSQQQSHQPLQQQTQTQTHIQSQSQPQPSQPQPSQPQISPQLQASKPLGIFNQPHQHQSEQKSFGLFPQSNDQGKGLLALLNRGNSST
ncbi:DCP2 [Candida pseudojiufengensis]|uniref:DCP2 n=1 Tax=Candida pseudojiufengensis TaxID=497109 RepID=UPI00222524C4|nr:DCP2 [Candida pseudojiufengensis]KAI5962646.1 DCP2 [Candida pseudojiufengensis]